MMKAVVEVDEKKRKKMMPGSAGSGSSSGAPPKYRMVYTPPRVSCVDCTAVELGQSPTIPTAAVPAATIQPCSYSTTTVGRHKATIAVSHQQLSMLQLREDGALCSRMPPAKAKKLTASFDTRGQPTEGPS
jgi:hypothetical protein